MTSGLDDLELTTDATTMTQLYVRTLNSGNAEAVNNLYLEDAITVWEPGSPINGQARHDSVVEFIARKPTMRAEVLESYVTGDTALMVVDWTIDVAGENGEPEHLTGVGLDVLRRGEDGYWRYALDNPYGAH